MNLAIDVAPYETVFSKEAMLREEENPVDPANPYDFDSKYNLSVTFCSLRFC